MPREKCPCCKTGFIDKVSHGDYPGDYDYWCSNSDCFYNEDAKERAEERWQDYLENTWQDDDGERHYY